MTLKEKFKKIDIKLSENHSTLVTDIEADIMEQIADEFAIEFAEWVMENCDRFPKEDRELILKLFKKEKGL
jgi:hypothetical protein